MLAGKSIFQQGFLAALYELEQWAGQQNPRPGRALVRRVVDFASDVIGSFPLAFLIYPFPRAPNRPLHRAVLDRRYTIIYEVQPTQLLLIFGYSTYQTPDLLELPIG